MTAVILSELLLELLDPGLHALVLVPLLLVALLPLLGGELHVDGHDVLDRLGALAELEGGLGLRLVEGGRRGTDDHGGLGIASQGLLQNTGQLGISAKIKLR